MARAIRQRWEMTPQKKARIVRELYRIVTGEESDARSKIAAAKALISMEAQNQSDEQANALQHDRSRFLEIAEQLGFDTSSGYVTEARTDSDTE